MDNITLNVLENTRNLPIDISQNPIAFPEETVLFTWTRDGQLLISGPGLSLTYSSVIFSNVDRQNSGNYQVFTSNIIQDREVGNDTGSFNLNVICKLRLISMFYVHVHIYSYPHLPIFFKSGVQD